MWRMRALFLAVALVSCASAPEPAPSTADPIIAAERAFAAEAAERGWAGAFRVWHAPDAMVLSPDPISAAESLAQVDGDGTTALDWRPAYAGIARSGDFGFTTGPFLLRGREGIVGHYFTVWRKQPDGTWRWIFDAGANVADPGPPTAPDAAIPVLPPGDAGAGSAQAAIVQVRALERRITLTRPDPRQRLIYHFSQDVRLNRTGLTPAIGREAATAAAMETAIGFSDAPIRVEASAAGDLVFVLGPIEGDAYYARILQLQSEGWRIVFDEIVPGAPG